MKTRGFVIGFLIFAASATAAYIIGVARPAEKADITMSSTLAMAIEEAMRNHKKRNEVFPPGTNPEVEEPGKKITDKSRRKREKKLASQQTSADRVAIATALRGERALAQDHLNILPFILKDGELVDVWGHPFLIGVAADERPFAISPGPNGKFHDGDDVTSKEAKKTAKLLEEDS